MNDYLLDPRKKEKCSICGMVITGERFDPTPVRTRDLSVFGLGTQSCCATCYESVVQPILSAHDLALIEYDFEGMSHKELLKFVSERIFKD